MKIIQSFVASLVIFILQQTSAQENLCPQNFTQVSNKCIYLGQKTNWSSAVQRCSQLKANISLINNNLQEFILLLLNKKINSIWIEAKRNGAFEPITYQLPTSIYYGKKFSIFNQTHDLWLENEPSLLEEESCVVGVLIGTTLRIKMERCPESLHNFVCITDICDTNGKICQQGLAGDQEFDALQAPKMDLRKVNNEYILDVYNSQKLWNYTHGRRIRNPVCLLEDGSTRVDNVCTLDLISKLKWTDKNITTEGFANLFKYSITKDTYRIITEATGYLSCRAFIDGTMEQITTNRIIHRTDKKYHVFAVGLLYRVTTCSTDFCEPTYSGDFWESLAQNLTKELQSIQGLEKLTLRPIKMINRNGDKISLVFRAKIRIKNGEEEIEEGYNYLNQLNSQLRSRSLNYSDELLEVLYIRSSRFCHEEKTQSNVTLHWPTASVGQVVLSKEFCISEDGTPAKRKCTGNFVEGAFWSNEREIFKCIQPSGRTSYLYNLSSKGKSNVKATETLIGLQNILVSQDLNENSKVRFAKLDINMVAKTMENLKNAEIIDTDLTVIANVTDSVMKLSASNNATKDMLGIETTNASNVFLESLDSMLNRAKLNESEALTITSRFVSLVLDIDSNSKSYNGIQGLAALDSSKHSYFHEENIITLPWNMSVDHLLRMNISAAVFLPPQFAVRLSKASNCNNSSINKCNQNIPKRHRLVINMFWDDGLFKLRTGTPMHIISVTLDGVKHYDLDHPLILLFKNSRHYSSSSEKKNCVFWDFQADEGQGNWSDIGCALATRLDTSAVMTDVCICTHLTHFGHLVSSSVEEEIDLVLDLITIAGCSASLLGLLGIGLTATIFPEWRHGVSKKIQLHLSASLGILMSVFLVNAFSLGSQEESLGFWICLTMGVILHFAVISTFSWMLVAAWFQYLRLTKPLASRHRAPHILLKSAIFAWGVPLIPCGTLLIISPESYNSPQCYPTGLAHYATVMCPIAIIISLNMAMYVLIICSIFNLCKFGAHINLELQYSNNPRYQRSLACRRLGTLIFLFFLLGLSWLFGIWKLSYLFCCTATLQGLAFFVFFVILEKNTRAKWNLMLSRRKTIQDYSLSNRSSLGFSLRRWSHNSRLTSQTTTSTLSSASFPLHVEKHG